MNYAGWVRLAVTAITVDAMGRPDSMLSRSSTGQDQSYVPIVGETVRRERRWTPAGATPARELVRSTR